MAMMARQESSASSWRGNTPASRSWCRRWSPASTPSSSRRSSTACIRRTRRSCWKACRQEQRDAAWQLIQRDRRGDDPAGAGRARCARRWSRCSTSDELARARPSKWTSDDFADLVRTCRRSASSSVLAQLGTEQSAEVQPCCLSRPDSVGSLMHTGRRDRPRRRDARGRNLFAARAGGICRSNSRHSSSWIATTCCAACCRSAGSLFARARNKVSDVMDKEPTYS